MSSRVRRLTATLVFLLTLALLSAPPAGAATTRTVTDCGDAGLPGQLRFLISAAASGDTIVIPACTITLGAILSVNKNLSISGAGPNATIVDGASFTQVFGIGNGSTVSISGVTVRNANVSGINNSGTLTLSNSSVTGTAGGAGIFNGGTLAVTNSTVSGNAGGVDGGGIANGGPLTVTGSTISGNTAMHGGGIRNNSGNATVVNSTITGNMASQDGGGIRNDGAGSTLTVTNSTVANNSAGPVGGGGLFLIAGGTVSLRNTIVAGNSTTGIGANCNGLLASFGHNLSSDPSCVGFTATGDLNNANPLLGPLQNNGGPTPTLALLPGSPAIDAGDNAGCPATDQRGVPRPLDTKSAGVVVCDIGAFEVETLGFIQATLTLNTAAVRPGTLLQGTVTVSNGGGARPVDAYLAFVLPPAAGSGLGCPAGDAIAFVTAGFAQVTLSCVSSPVRTFTPFLANVTVPANLGPTSVSLFSLVWPGAPTGSYTVALVLTPVGAFSDGRVNPTAALVTAPAGFSATP